MTSPHLLDRAVWSALSRRQAQLALVEGGARRIDPAFGVFAALQDGSAEALAGLATLVAAHGDVALLQAEAPPIAPGLAIVSQDLGVQMVAERLTSAAPPAFEIVRLSDADAAEMLALATLTRPMRPPSASTSASASPCAARF